MGRFGRQIERFRKGRAAGRSKSAASDTSGKLADAATPPDVSSVRAKSTRHRKVTADKWNQ